MLRRFFLVEIRQNFISFLGLALSSFVVGAFLAFGQQALEEIRSLIVPVDWQADLVVLPKGVDLRSLRASILSGQSEAFLPYALFETTRDLAKGQFQLSAILVDRNSDGPVIGYSGDFIGLGNLKEEVRTQIWQEPSSRHTPEWGNHLISAMFARGSMQTMQSLKELVDKRTIAQAIWIASDQQKEERLQNKLMLALQVVIFGFATVFLLYIYSIISHLRFRFDESFVFAAEMGYPRILNFSLLGATVFLFFVVPTFLSFILFSQLTLFVG